MFTLILALVTFVCGLIVGIVFGPEIHNMVARATLDKAGDEDRKAAKYKLPRTTSDGAPLIDEDGYWVGHPKARRTPKRKNKHKGK